MNEKEIEKVFIEYIDKQEGILCTFGKLCFTNKNRIGQGGNGLVYLAKINGREVAVKFLISDSENKKRRFKSEFFNTNYVKNKLYHVVNMIHYDEVIMNEEISIPYIIMSRYSQNLKSYRRSKTELQREDFLEIVKFLFNSIASIHRQNILHRDIKPENILVDSEGKFFLADFGIAHFDKENFPIDNRTKKGERLANIEFSAPEQINHQYELSEATDIYSMAQIMYWYIFGVVNRGTDAEHISSKYDWEEAYIFDLVINKCLRNNPSERFQSINEIAEFIQSEKEKRKELDPFDDMYEFHDAVLSVVPEFYDYVFEVTDKNVMCNLFEVIFSKKYNCPLEFNTGKGNNTVRSITRLENDDFLMGGRQINIIRIWGLLTDDIYDDILLLELGESVPYIIDGKECYTVAVINDEEMVPYQAIASGFVRYRGTVHKISDLKIQERWVSNDYKVIAIAPFHSCTIIAENDKYMEKLQSKTIVQEKDVYELKKSIHMNRTNDVWMRM